MIRALHALRTRGVVVDRGSSARCCEVQGVAGRMQWGLPRVKA
jgi:hypothetical protein